MKPKLKARKAERGWKWGAPASLQAQVHITTLNFCKGSLAPVQQGRLAMAAELVKKPNPASPILPSLLKNNINGQEELLTRRISLASREGLQPLIYPKYLHNIFYITDREIKKQRSKAIYFQHCTRRPTASQGSPTCLFFTILHQAPPLTVPSGMVCASKGMAALHCTQQGRKDSCEGSHAAWMRR